MPSILGNPHRGTGLPALGPRPADDPRQVADLLALCPAHAPTPLTPVPALAARAGVGQLWLKDERHRMGLGSFKALGAAHAIARDAAARRQGGDWAGALAGRRYVTASAGNHGLSVTAGARLFGAEAVVYLAETVPDAFADRLREMGAEVLRAGVTYEDSMAAAEAGARAGGVLLSDSSWPGYTELPFRVMEGYLQLAAETAEALEAPPDWIVVQAGVGGLAAAVAAHARAAWGEAPRIAVVEPEAAPALAESVRAGRLVTTSGPVSCMGRLDCKTPSMIALAGLAQDADLFVTIDEAEARTGAEALAAAGLPTTPSGAAGVAALLAGLSGLESDARVLAYVTEGPEDG
jgi:diaminopropionate ammonia-lyase